MAKGYTTLSEKMRNAQFRGKPIAILAFLVTTGFLVFNFWTLSTQNTDLQKMIEDLKLKIEFSGRRQAELEEQLDVWRKRYEESHQETVKLTGDLKKKDDIVQVQADESALFGDKIRLAESEIEKLKSTLNQKENELREQNERIEALEKELSEKVELISRGSSKLKEAQQLQSLSESNQLKTTTQAKDGKSSTSTSKPAEQSQVLAKPNEENEGQDRLNGRYPIDKDIVNEEPELQVLSKDNEVQNVDPETLSINKDEGNDPELPVLAAPNADNRNADNLSFQSTGNKESNDAFLLSDKETENSEKPDDEDAIKDFDADQGDN